MSTVFFVMTHKEFKKPSCPDYRPLHVGRADKNDLGYEGDDTGDNISRLNCYYGELTGIYWIWKNYTGQENIGICHYRRYFVDEEKRILTGAEADALLKSYDLITTKNIPGEKSARESYDEAHIKGDFDIVGDALIALHPEDEEVFRKLSGEPGSYFGNLCVMPRKTFDAYCEWLFPIFEKAAEKIHPESYDEYHRRIWGFYSEFLLYVYVKARGLSPYECPVAFSEEKQETIQLKLAMKQLFSEGKYEEARELFDGVLSVRPDLTLESADISGELPLISGIIDEAIREKKSGEAGPALQSRDLFELIEYYRKQQG